MNLIKKILIIIFLITITQMIQADKVTIKVTNKTPVTKKITIKAGYMQGRQRREIILNKEIPGNARVITVRIYPITTKKGTTINQISYQLENENWVTISAPSRTQPIEIIIK